MSHLRALKLPLEMWQKIPIISYLYAKIIHRTLLKSLSIPGETQLACFSQLFDNEPIGKSLQHLEMEKKSSSQLDFYPIFYISFLYNPTFLAPIEPTVYAHNFTCWTETEEKKLQLVFCYLTVTYGKHSICSNFTLS